LYLSQISLSSDVGLTIDPAICLFIFFGSSSKRATTPNPLSLKPTVTDLWNKAIWNPIKYDDYIHPVNKDVVKDTVAFLKKRVAFAISAGIDKDKIIVDPGIGFAKGVEQNLQILNRGRNHYGWDIGFLKVFSNYFVSTAIASAIFHLAFGWF
jgi:dihydropteroate synthase